MVPGLLFLLQKALYQKLNFANGFSNLIPNKLTGSKCHFMLAM